MTSNGAPSTMLQVGTRIECKGHVFNVEGFLSSGAFGDVYKVKDVENGKQYAMKTEPKSILRASLKYDVYVLTLVSGRIGFPRLLLSGQVLDRNMMVMQILGQNLAQPNQRFTPATTLRIARQTLNRIESLHAFGLINRDIKASNFAIAFDSNIDPTIYMLDFGFSCRYRPKRGSVPPPRSSSALLGTVLYTSLASHAKSEQGRKDDLESWFYMIIEMYTGSLPWSKYYEVKDHEKAAELKQFYREPGYYQRRVFLKECPLQFDTILSLIDLCGFLEEPEYSRIHAQITLAFSNLGLNDQETFDWQKNISV